MKTVNIDQLGDLLSDDGQFPARMGHRNPASPAFIFFDDAREADPDILWGRDLALDFEEWVALQNHNEALDSRKEVKASLVKVAMQTPACIPTHSILHDSPKFGIRAASDRDKKRARQFTRKVQPQPEGVSIEHRDDFTEAESEEISAFFERNEARGLCNWLVNWHKNRPSTNDHWHTALSRIISKVPLDDEATMVQLAKVKKVLAGFTNYAPGPISETVFKNMDGSRYVTNGADFGRAKASYITAQKKRGYELTDELVSVDRVQYIGDKKSKLVVGVRKASDQTPSNYYDPNPTWMEKKIRGKWIKTYAPGATTLYVIPPSLVMPDGSYRLTVRDFEQCIIAGADIVEEDWELTAKELEDEYLPDSRILLMNFGYGSDGRDPMALTHEEAYLHGVFLQLGARDDDPFFTLACELLCLEEQSPGILAAHFMGQGGFPCEQAHMVHSHVARDDEEREDGETYLPYVVDALSLIPEGDTERRADAKSITRDNKRMLSKEHDYVEYGFQALIGNYRAPW